MYASGGGWRVEGGSSKQFYDGKASSSSKLSMHSTSRDLPWDLAEGGVKADKFGAYCA